MLMIPIVAITIVRASGRTKTSNTVLPSAMISPLACEALISMISSGRASGMISPAVSRTTIFASQATMIIRDRDPGRWVSMAILIR